MPRRGIHPVLNKMTYVFRNGASVELPSVMFSKKPIIMQVVRRHSVCLGKLSGAPESKAQGVTSLKGLLHHRTQPAIQSGRARSGQ